MLLWTRVPLPRVAPLGRLPPTNCLCLGPMTAAMTSPSAKQVCGGQPGFLEYGSLEVGGERGGAGLQVGVYLFVWVHLTPGSLLPSL